MSPEEATRKMHELAKLPEAERIQRMKAMPFADVAEIQAAAMVENLNHNVRNRIDPELPAPSPLGTPRR